MKSFEIHTMRDGRWAIDSIFNDRELALFEARRADENRRYTGVRVIEEIYDETSGLTTHRTIYRGRKSSARRTDGRKGTERTSRAAPAPRGGVGQERAPKARSPVQNAKKKSTVLVPVLLALLLLFMGVAGLLGLHLLSGNIG